jgi:hypothetical protein
MTDVDRLLDNARIEGDGTVPPDDVGNDMGFVFIFSTEGFRVWFVSKLKFLENENDYIVEIIDFGRLQRVTTDHMTFDPTAVEKIKSLLESYFCGPDSSFARRFASTPGPKSTCYGVDFKNGWIRVA